MAQPPHKDTRTETVLTGCSCALVNERNRAEALELERGNLLICLCRITESMDIPHGLTNVIVPAAPRSRETRSLYAAVIDLPCGQVVLPMNNRDFQHLRDWPRYQGDMDESVSDFDLQQRLHMPVPRGLRLPDLLQQRAALDDVLSRVPARALLRALWRRLVRTDGE